MMRRLHWIVCLLLAMPSSRVCGDSPAEFELHAGDRVVFLGNSFFERALPYGHLETQLVIRWPERSIQFRNLGWDGDTVFGHSRAGGRRRAVFGDAKEGFQRMVAHVKSLQPTVIFLMYGLNESFESDLNVTEFRYGLEKLIRVLDKPPRQPPRRFVLFAPLPLAAGFGVDALAGQGNESYIRDRNQILSRYRDTVSRIAERGSHTFVDCFQFQNLDTDNGIHLNADGYRELAKFVTTELNLPPPLVNASQIEAIRKSIVKKNYLYFHRWRPRNDAFVYGERKDEQKIAQVEPAKFEPFIAQQEAVIRELLRQGAAK